MADSKYSVEVNTKATGDGAEKTIDKLDKLNKTVDENAKATNPMSEGWDEFTESQEKVADQVEKTTAAIEKQNEQVEKQKRLPALREDGQNDFGGRRPKAEITRAKLSRMEKFSSATKKLGVRARSAGVGLGKMLGLAGLVTFAASKGSKVFNKWGGSVSSLGEDLKLTNSLGGDTVSWIGKATSAIGSFLGKANFIGNYISAVKKSAAASRELAAVEQKIARQRKQFILDAEKSSRALKKSVRESKAYESAALRRADAEKAHADALKETNRALDIRARKLDQAAGKASDELDLEEESELLDVEADTTLTDSQKDVAREKIIEKFRQKRFDLEQQVLAEEIKIMERRKASLVADTTEKRRQTEPFRNADIKSDKELEEAEEKGADMMNQAMALIDQLNKTDDPAERERLKNEFEKLTAEGKRLKGLRADRDKKLNDFGVDSESEYRSKLQKKEQELKDAEEAIEELQTDISLSNDDFKNNKQLETKKRANSSRKLELSKTEKVREAEEREKEKASRSVGGALDKVSGLPLQDGKFKNKVEAAINNNADGTNLKELDIVIGIIRDVVADGKEKSMISAAQAAELKKLQTEVRSFKTLYKNNLK